MAAWLCRAESGRHLMKPKLRLLALALALVPLPAFASPSAPDTGAPDTGAPDTGAPDTGASDTGAPDTGAPDMGASGTDLLDLSLEELMDIEISSVSKRAQPLSRIPAAVHVISAEQIRRSGAANIPEALRLAPGVHVARFSNNRWSVSIRGFGGRFASKLLVLQLRRKRKISNAMALRVALPTLRREATANDTADA